MSRRPDTIPVAPGWPLIGQLPAFRWQRLQLLADIPARYGPMAVLPLGPFEIVLVTDAALAREVLVEQADASTKSRTLTRFARQLLGDGLLTSERDVHRRQRKLMAPQSLAAAQISRWGDEMVRQGECAAAKWRDGQVIDGVYEMMRLTLSIVGRTLFDVDVALESAWVGRAFEVANRHTAVEWHVSCRCRWHYRHPVAARTLARSPTSTDSSGDSSSNAGGQVRPATTCSRKRVGARDEDDGRTMSDGELRDEIMTLFFAGHETTANALAWAWRLLAKNPTARARLEAEVDAVLWRAVARGWRSRITADRAHGSEGD